MRSICGGVYKGQRYFPVIHSEFVVTLFASVSHQLLKSERCDYLNCSGPINWFAFFVGI